MLELFATVSSIKTVSRSANQKKAAAKMHCKQSVLLQFVLLVDKHKPNYKKSVYSFLLSDMIKILLISSLFLGCSPQRSERPIFTVPFRDKKRPAAC